MTTWMRIALQRDIVIRGLRVSLLVGSALVVINQGDRLLSGTIDPLVVAKIILTYCIPYLVSTYAGVEATGKSR